VASFVTIVAGSPESLDQMVKRQMSCQLHYMMFGIHGMYKAKQLRCFLK